MYTPPHFAETDAAEIAALVARAPLACVVAQGPEGLLANHIPLLQAPNGELIGHVARANDIHRLLPPETPCLAIFQGPEAYVTPNAYPTKTEHHRHVPTWNYQVVHMHGRLRFDDSLSARRRAVGLLTVAQERGLNGSEALRMADAPQDYMDEMLDAIVAFTITVERVEAKSKLSQNRLPRDYAGTVENLSQRGETDLVEAMRRAEHRATEATATPRKDPS